MESQVPCHRRSPTLKCTGSPLVTCAAHTVAVLHLHSDMYFVMTWLDSSSDEEKVEQVNQGLLGIISLKEVIPAVLILVAALIEANLASLQDSCLHLLTISQALKFILPDPSRGMV